MIEGCDSVDLGVSVSGGEKVLTGRERRGEGHCVRGTGQRLGVLST